MVHMVEGNLILSFLSSFTCNMVVNKYMAKDKYTEFFCGIKKSHVESFNQMPHGINMTHTIFLF